jgi:hypothetical protein
MYEELVFFYCKFMLYLELETYDNRNYNVTECLSTVILLVLLTENILSPL